MTHAGIAPAVALAMGFAPLSAAAQEWSAEATLATEYISKGVGRSAGEPHVALQVQRTLGEAAYAGAWTGTLRSPLGADGETHLYVGWRPKAAGWSFDVRPMVKLLSGASGDDRTAQFEMRVDAARSMGPARLRLRVEHTPNGYGPSKASTWMEASLSRKVAGPWSVVAGVGRREQEEGRDYTAWNAGVQRALGEGARLEVRWIDTAESGAGREYRSRLVAALTARF